MRSSLENGWPALLELFARAAAAAHASHIPVT
jgi:hypothetical protein